MRMTKDQAVDYCRRNALGSLDGTPGGEQVSSIWQSLREDIERNGLEHTEQACVAWRDTQYTLVTQSHQPLTVLQDNRTYACYDEFLIAIDDDDEVERAIAGEILVKIHAELEAKASLPLRSYYLSCFRNHLENVLGGSMDLDDYKVAREGIEAQLMAFEEEYGKWVDEALKAQE